MSIDLKKLENVHESGEKVTARCPACAQDGGDVKGEHLVVFKDGKFGCVAYPKDKEHNRAIFKLAGTSDKPARQPMKINRLVFAESKTIMSVGHLGRVNPSPDRIRAESVAPPSVNQSVSGVERSGPARPSVNSPSPTTDNSTVGWQMADALVSTPEEIDRFLGRTS